MAKTEQWAHVACPIECPLISNVVVGESYGTYISLCEKVAHKRHAETCCHQSTRSPSPSPPVSVPFYIYLSESVCRNNPLQFERIVIPPCALCWCCSPYPERTLQPCTTDSQTVRQPDGRQLLCHHYDCVIAHQQQPQQQHRAQATTASTAWHLQISKVLSLKYVSC